jgi:transglutaminase-like putative cysteine protease
MQIAYGYRIDMVCDHRTPVITMLDVHPDRAGDRVTLDLPQVTALATGETLDASMIYTDQFGNLCRRIMAPAGGFSIRADGVIRDSGLPDQADLLAEHVPPERLPHETLVYLLGSRYCETDLLVQEAWSRFGHIAGGHAKVKAICDFTHGHIRFDYNSARSTRSAHDAFREGVGVCRDYAHLALTLCRCLNIPARYCTGYLGEIGVPPDPNPGDFSGWFEAFVGGRWWTFDARHNKARIGRIVMARGRDATDVPILNSFGAHVLQHFEVITYALPDADAHADGTTGAKPWMPPPMIQTPAA